MGGRGQRSGWRSRRASVGRHLSVGAADEQPAPVGPVEGQVEDPATSGSPSPVRPAAAGLDPPQLPLGEQVADRRAPRARLGQPGRRPRSRCTARTPVDCHHGPVSTQCASTARTFHSRPRHRNCSGPSCHPAHPTAVVVRSRTSLVDGTSADLDGVGVAPHAVSSPGGRSNMCSNTTKVHRPADSPSTPGSTTESGALAAPARRAQSLDSGHGQLTRRGHPGAAQVGAGVLVPEEVDALRPRAGTTTTDSTMNTGGAPVRSPAMVPTARKNSVSVARPGPSCSRRAGTRRAPRSAAPPPRTAPPRPARTPARAPRRS